MTLGVTGHRPDKMRGYGYDLASPAWQKLIRLFIYRIMGPKGCDEAVSGMALGVDQAWALAALFAKELGFDIRLTCAVPCDSQSSVWPPESRKLYDEILRKADEVHIVTPGVPYEPWMMQKRNIWILDRSDELVSVWDGSRGGTGNCVQAALKRNMPITNIDPATLAVSVLR